MKPSSSLASGLTLAVYLLICPCAFPQGSLTPPGPPEPTMKTLDQVEPRIIINANNCPGDSSNQFIINSGGSYYLAGRILGVANKNGILIQSDNVTVDLNGFAVNGNVSNSQNGIVVNGTYANIAIRNGTVTNWGISGIALGFTSINSQVKDIRTSNNGSFGIQMNTGAITNCTASNNHSDGISATNSTITNCASNNNHGSGISTSLSTITNCAALANDGRGIDAFGGTVTNCTASENNLDGIFANLGAVTNSTAALNKTNGIAGIACTITDCSADENTTDGIVVSVTSTVVRNRCQSNSAAGVHVTGSTNEIEQNNVTGNAAGGIQVDSTSNLIIRNSARNNGGTNGNYSIVAGNRIGIIIAPATSSASGNTGGSAVSTDAWANIAY